MRFHLRRIAALTLAGLVLASVWCCPVRAQVPGGGVGQSGPVTANDCAAWVGNGLIKDAGAACGSGGGGTPGGTNGQIQFNNSGSFGGLTPAIATACGGTGGTIGASLVGTISTQETISAQAGANYAIVTGNCGQLVNLNNAGAQTPTIPVAGSAGFPAGWYVDVCNIGAGAQTLTPASGTVGGAATRVFAAGSASAPVCARLISDGVSNYVVVFPQGSAGGSGNALFGTTTGNTSGDVVTMSNTTVGVQDSGTALSALAPLASPSFTTPTLGVASATSINKVALTAPATAATLTIANNKTLTVSNSLTFTGTDSTSFAFPGTSDTVATLAAANAFSAANSFAGTTNPTMSAGLVFVYGSQATAPTMSSNGEGAIFLGGTSGTTNGLTLQGKGSTNDVTLANSAGTAVCRIPTGVTSMTCAGLNLNGGVLVSTALVTATNNTSFASASTSTLNIGNSGNISSGATAAGSVTIQAPGSTSTTSGGNGGSVNITAGNFTAASGGNAAGSIVLTIGTAGGGSGTPGSLQFVNLPQTSVAQSGTVCFNTSGSAVTYDATLGCLTSLEEMKDIHGPIIGALAEVIAFKPFWFTPINRPAGSDLAEQPGFGAHQIESVDPRLVGYDEHGNLRGVRYMEMTALEAAAITELKNEFDEYRKAHP